MVTKRIWIFGLLVLAITWFATNSNYISQHVEGEVQEIVEAELNRAGFAHLPFTQSGRDVYLHLPPDPDSSVDWRDLTQRLSETPGVGSAFLLRGDSTSMMHTSMQASSTSARSNTSLHFDGSSVTLVGTGSSVSDLAPYLDELVDRGVGVNNYLSGSVNTHLDWEVSIEVWLAALTNFQSSTMTISESGIWLDSEDNEPGSSAALLEVLEDKVTFLSLISKQQVVVVEAAAVASVVNFSNCNEEITGLIELNPISFDYGRARLKSTSAPVLSDVKQVFEVCGGSVLNVIGHTDSIGSAKANLRISQLRANAVKKHLIGLGIAEDQIIAVGEGEEMPIASNLVEEGRAQNRRIEFKMQ